MQPKTVVDGDVLAALKDDLNTPLAISRLHDLATTIHKTMDEAERSRLASTLKASGQLMGVLQQEPNSWFHGNAGKAADGITPSEIEAQIEARQDARNRKDFAESDRIRDTLLQHGIVLEDDPGGTTWRKG